MNKPNLTQEKRILEVLEKNRGKWIHGQYFSLTMWISQYHRAIHNLEHRDKIDIEHSDPDEHGFISYRLINKSTLF